MKPKNQSAPSPAEETASECGFCDGSGSVDSGGTTPWGEGIDIKCGYCDGTGKEPLPEPVSPEVIHVPRIPGTVNTPVGPMIPAREAAGAKWGDPLDPVYAGEGNIEWVPEPVPIEGAIDRSILVSPDLFLTDEEIAEAESAAPIAPAAEELIQELVSALRKIANPITYMRLEVEARGDGAKLNGRAAVELSNDANYLKGIARTALTRAEEYRKGAK